MLDCFPQQRLVQLAHAEHFFCQLQGADFLSAEIVYVHVCHRFSFLRRPGANGSPSSNLAPFYLYKLFCKSYFFLLAAFFEAFSGSTVPAPPNPRRSRGGALAFEIRT